MTANSYPQTAVIGSGYWGRNLVRNFYELGALKMVVDENLETLSALAAQYPGLKTSNRLDEALSDPEIKAVAVATPAFTHYRLSAQALKAGKDVLVEKPLTLNINEAENLCRLAESNGRILMVDHLLHQHPAVIALKNLVATGQLGRIHHFQARRLNFGRIRCEENAMWSLSPHDISLMLGLMNAWPTEVAAKGGRFLNNQVEDQVEMDLGFPGGATAHLSASWLNPVKEQTITIVGSEKMAVFNDLLPWPEKLKIYPHRVEWNGLEPKAAPAEAQAVNLEPAEPLKRQCQAFLEAVITRRPPQTDGWEGLKTLTVLSALQESLDKGGRPVKLGPFGQTPNIFVHETAIIDHGVKIGPGTKIWCFAHVLSDTEIGENCVLGQNVVAGPHVKIGAGCKIQNNVSVYEGVELEDEVFCGPSMVFTNVFNPRAAVNRKHEFRKTLVKKGATLGANCTVVCGHTLGEYCFIGAGAVVTSDVAPHALMAGVPARQIGWMCRCGQKLNSALACPECGLAYQLDGDTLKPAQS